jgi:hypothetical protein
MAHGASPGTPGCIGPSDEVPALGFPGAAGPGLARLLLSGSPDLLSLPINWGASGGPHEASMFTGRSRRKATVRNAGHCRPGYPTSNLGYFQDKAKFT